LPAAAHCFTCPQNTPRHRSTYTTHYPHTHLRTNAFALLVVAGLRTATRNTRFARRARTVTTTVPTAPAGWTARYTTADYLFVPLLTAARKPHTSIPRWRFCIRFYLRVLVGCWCVLRLAKRDYCLAKLALLLHALPACAPPNTRYHHTAPPAALTHLPRLATHFPSRCI